MARIRIRFHLGKKQRLFLEIGIAVLCLILFLGALNTITYTSKTLILTTRDLLNTTVTIAYYGYNATEGKWYWITEKTYNVSDIATYYDGWLYLSIPYDTSAEYDEYAVAFIEFHTNYTHRQLVEMGLNRIEFAVKFDQPIDRDNDEKVAFVFGIVKRAAHPDWWSYYSPYKYTANTSSSIEFNGTVSIDPADYMFFIASYNLHNTEAAIGIAGNGDLIGSNTVMLKIDMYAISEKPVLKSLSEPVYGVVSALWATLLAFWKRVKSYVASAFGGFSLSALFTGLIGDPVTAMILSIVIVTVLFLVMKKGRR